VVETIFDEAIAEDVNQDFVGNGADNFSAILVDFHANKANSEDY
jgi:hypothetical protein